MHRSQVKELHFIAPIQTVPSILKLGILSHNRAAHVPHADVSMEEVQDIRRGKRIPNGPLLHDCANVYLQARNPMLYKLLGLRHSLCVLRVHPSALDLPGAIVADGNAAVSFTGFAPAPGGIAIVDYATTFAERWTHEDPWEYRRRKAASCAEVLVPDWIPPEYIVGAWVASTQALKTFRALGVSIEARRNPRLFFQV